MPLTATFNDSCRTAVRALAEYTAYNTAGALSATTRAAALARWGALYAADSQGTSVAYRLRKAIRDTVNAKADSNAMTSATGTITAMERESLIQTLQSEFCPVIPRPLSGDEEFTAYEAARKEEVLR